MEFKTKAKKWGNSLGIILPKRLTRKEHIKAGNEITIQIKEKNVLRETFGMFKFKKSVQEMMRETDKELYNE
jgi:antitoxin component of MazEF toxin-antitoxin module